MSESLSFAEINQRLEGVHLFHDYVLVYPLGRTEFQSTLIEIPGSADVPNFGYVVAAGPGRLTAKRAHIPIGVAPGDRVLYESRAGDRIEAGGLSLLLLKESFLSGVLEGEDDGDSQPH